MEQTEKKFRPGFRISYNETTENEAIANEFKEFCKETCDDVYILGIRDLLKAMKEDWKGQLLMNAYNEHEDRLNALEEQDAPVKKEKSLKTFGDE
jgi:hypothetical protein